jgi:preprotein translocase subunit SecG
MSLFLFLTVVQALIAAALVGVVLMQRSEGGGLGIGGSPSGALGARGAADFMTRATKWLAVAFVALSIVLAALAVRESGVSTVSTTLDRNVAAPAGSTDLLADPAGAPAGDAGAAAPAAPPATSPAAAPTTDPLAE